MAECKPFSSRYLNEPICLPGRVGHEFATKDTLRLGGNEPLLTSAISA
jgi:hypothetical protein